MIDTRYEMERESEMRRAHLLDFDGVHVGAAADDKVLEASNDLHVALAVHAAQVAGTQPAALAEHLARALFVAPVAEHHREAAHDDLTLVAARHHVALLVHQLHFHVVEHAAHRRDSLLSAHKYTRDTDRWFCAYRDSYSYAKNVLAREHRRTSSGSVGNTWWQQQVVSVAP